MANSNNKLSAAFATMVCVAAPYLLSGCSSDPVEPQRTILERQESISGLEKRAFSIEGSAGDVLLVELRQSGLDLYLEQSIPAGTVVGRFESYTGRYGEERAVIPIREDGQITLHVGAARNPRVTGRFHLIVTRVGLPEPADLAFSDGSRMREVMDVDGRVADFENAARGYRARGMPLESGLAGLAAITLLNDLGSDAPRAVQNGEQAVAAFRQVDDAHLRAASANLLGWATDQAGDAERMREAFAEARAYYEIARSPIGIAEVELTSAAASNAELAVPQRMEILRRVIDECEKLHETICQAKALGNLGSYLQAELRESESLEAHFAALSLIDIDADSDIYGGMNDNLAFSLRQQGDFDGAIYHHRTALAAYARIGYCPGVSRSLYGLGYAMLGIGDHEQALRFFQVAVPRYCSQKRLNEVRAQVERPSLRDLCSELSTTDVKSLASLSVSMWIAYDLGTLARAEGDVTTALTCHEASLALAQQDKSARGDRLAAKLEQVRDLIDLGRDVDAAALYESVVVRDTEYKDAHLWYRAHAAEISAIFLARKRDRAAFPAFLDAAKMFDESGNSEGAYSAYRRRASLASEIGDRRMAEYFAEADVALEKVRLLSFDPAYSASLFASGRDIYEQWIEGVLKFGARENAEEQALRTLAISERSRARLLAQIIGANLEGSSARDVRVRLLAGDTTESLEHIERGVQPEFPATTKEAMGLHIAGAGTAEPVRLARFGAPELDEFVRETKAFQRSLDSRSSVIEYLLGETRSHAWVLSDKEVVRVELAAASTIRDATRVARSLLDSGAPIEQTKAALGLLHALIIEPLQPHLSGNELSIVLDGVLNDVPFAALWDAKKGRFLVETTSFSYAPSIRFLLARRERASTGRGAALLVGDPVYDPGDAAGRCESKATIDGDRVKLANLKRIPASGREVAGIAAVFQGQRILPNVLTGCDANREHVLAATLEDYKYIHFAVHATADRIAPQRSAIYLSTYGTRGPHANSAITANDLITRKFDAELIVLSGCSTAGGREFQGEGALGLPFSLIARGSRHVLSTLWPVADAASVTAMRKLYEGLIDEQMSAAASLRAAQLDMLASGRWTHPRHWAVYSLLGT